MVSTRSGERICDRRPEGRAATDDDDDRITEHAQLIDQAKLVVAHRRIRLPRQHGLEKPAAAKTAAELACLREVETNFPVPLQAALPQLVVCLVID